MRRAVDAGQRGGRRLFGCRLDVLAHVAGIEHSADTEDITDAEWDAVFDVNMKGSVYTNQAAFLLMRALGGSIINSPPVRR